MSLLNYINRVTVIDTYITAGNTGNAGEFAKKLSLSKSRFLLHIKTMKALGLPVKFSSKHNSYYYSVKTGQS